MKSPNLPNAILKAARPEGSAGVLHNLTKLSKLVKSVKSKPKVVFIHVAADPLGVLMESMDSVLSDESAFSFFLCLAVIVIVSCYQFTNTVKLENSVTTQIGQNYRMKFIHNHA